MQRATHVNLRVIDPNGHVFEEEDLAYTPVPGAMEMNMMVGGMPMNPSNAIPVKVLQGGMALDYGIAIYGTEYKRYPFPGTWQVQATVDGDPKVYSASFDVVFAR
jgi:hypothetical protein